MPYISTRRPRTAGAPPLQVPLVTAEGTVATVAECTQCHNPNPIESTQLINSYGRVCEDCQDDFSNCDNCGDQHPEGRLFNFEGGEEGQICQYCAEANYTSCRSCGLYVFSEHMNPTNLCSNCYDNSNDDNSIAYRPYDDRTTEYQSEEHGIRILSTRKFGVELEVAFPTQELAAKASINLPRAVGVGEDGSIQGGAGLEIATPIASGIKAEALIHEVCKTLVKNKAMVNKTCGYHIHIDAKDLIEKDDSTIFSVLRDIWLFYITFEDVIHSFLPPSRRTGRYCLPLRTDFHFKEVVDCRNIESLELLWYRVKDKPTLNHCKDERKHDSRYRGVNMHTLLSEHHLEIRYHSGTVQPLKILEWANLHLRIVDKCFYGVFDADTLRALCAISDLGEKTKQFFSLLMLNKKSEDYFRARQATLMKPHAYEGTAEALKETQDALQAESEQ